MASTTTSKQEEGVESWREGEGGGAHAKCGRGGCRGGGVVWGLPSPTLSTPTLVHRVVHPLRTRGCTVHIELAWSSRKLVTVCARRAVTLGCCHELLSTPMLVHPTHSHPSHAVPCLLR